MNYSFFFEHPILGSIEIEFSWFEEFSDNGKLLVLENIENVCINNENISASDIFFDERGDYVSLQETLEDYVEDNITALVES